MEIEDVTLGFIAMLFCTLVYAPFYIFLFSYLHSLLSGLSESLDAFEEMYIHDLILLSLNAVVVRLLLHFLNLFWSDSVTNHDRITITWKACYKVLCFTHVLPLVYHFIVAHGSDTLRGSDGMTDSTSMRLLQIVWNPLDDVLMSWLESFTVVMYSTDYFGEILSPFVLQLVVYMLMAAVYTICRSTYNSMVKRKGFKKSLYFNGLASISLFYCPLLYLASVPTSGMGSYTKVRIPTLMVSSISAHPRRIVFPPQQSIL